LPLFRLWLDLVLISFYQNHNAWTNVKIAVNSNGSKVKATLYWISNENIWKLKFVSFLLNLIFEIDLCRLQLCLFHPRGSRGNTHFELPDVYLRVPLMPCSFFFLGTVSATFSMLSTTLCILASRLKRVTWCTWFLKVGTPHW